jgi:hypothetical protein
MYVHNLDMLKTEMDYRLDRARADIVGRRRRRAMTRRTVRTDTTR